MACSVDTVSCQLCGISEIDGIKFAKCTRCDVDVCDTCQDQHSLANRSHTFTIQTAEHEDKYEGDVCLYHPSHKIKYICHTHHALCCSECKLRHRTCHKIETITKSAIGVKTSSELRRLISDMKNVQETCEELTAISTTNLSRIEDAYSKVQMKIDNSMADIYKDIKQIKRSPECQRVAMINEEKPLVDHVYKSSSYLEHIEDTCMTFEINLSNTMAGIYQTIDQMEGQITERFKNIQQTQKERILKSFSQIKEKKNSAFVNRKHLQELLEHTRSETAIFLEFTKIKAIFLREKNNVDELCQVLGLIAFDIKITHILTPQNIVQVNAVMKVRSMRHKSTGNTRFVNREIPSERIDDETERDELYKTNYVFRNSFKIDRSERKPFIKDIQVLQNGKVILVDNNNPWLLVYEKFGNLVRTIELPDVPYGIALIKNTTLAVTIPSTEKLIFINAKDFRIQQNKDILLGDECFGIAYLENRIVVNCKEKGLIVINLNGTWEKEHPKVTGELSLCAGLDSCIFMTKQGAGSIVRFNIDTGEREYYRFPIFRPCGIAIDGTDLNVYVACHGSHQIIKFNWRSSEMSIILPSEDSKIVCPWAIDIDPNTSDLLISNYKSNIISVYEINYI